MPIPIDQLVSEINPEQTVLLFGSGSSIPSGAPSTMQICDHLAQHFDLESSDLNLPELSAIIERRRNRVDLIKAVRELFVGIEPTGGLLTIPRFKWKSIYTTNYDNLLEQAFGRFNEPLAVYASNFDFDADKLPNSLRLMKLHGSIEEDVSDGSKTRLIITENDYSLTEEYREYLYDSLKRDLAGADLIIIGYSLADPYIREIVNRALSISKQAMNIRSTYLFMYTPNKERAELHEIRGLKVCFAGIDEFAASLTKHGPDLVTAYEESSDPLDASRYLSPITIDVHHSSQLPPRVSEMFNGWPASYGDIASGNTFMRSLVQIAEKQLIENEHFGVIILGAGGVGKTTTARQIMHSLAKRNFYLWEHKSDHKLLHNEWLNVAKNLEKEGKNGAIFIDDSDSHLHEINILFESLSAADIKNLRVVVSSARNRWNHRIKSAALFSNSKIYELEKLNANEITELLRLVETSTPVRELVHTSFLDFSAGEQRRRLEERCERDVFVCLKNIFATEKFDDILLREYALLASEYQDIYKIVAALESSGIRVHRQLIIRLLGINMTTISAVLDHLDGIVREYVVNERDGIYGWRGRHGVIMEIIADYKFAETENYFDLYEQVISALNPIYDIEVRTLRQLCSVNTGIRRIADRHKQNRLLAKMISVAPGERVPRHRLIQNLIDMRQFEEAEAEIRLFSKDFGEDGPVYRYRIILFLERAKNAPGLMDEDRLVILDRARELAVSGVNRYPGNKHMLSTYCDIGIEIFKRKKDLDTFNDAIQKMKTAEENVGDPDISRQIAYYERRIETSIAMAPKD